MRTIRLGTVLYLSQIGVRSVEIAYSGGGDDGHITDIIYQTPYAGFCKVPPKIQREVENFAYDLLAKLGNWYDGEGGQGTISILIPSLMVNTHAEFNRETPWVEDENGDLIEGESPEPHIEYYEDELQKL